MYGFIINKVLNNCLVAGKKFKVAGCELRVEKASTGSARQSATNCFTSYFTIEEVNCFITTLKNA